MQSCIREYIRLVLKEDLSSIDPVHATAQYAHKGQTRRTGEPYIIHPQRVADSVKLFYPQNKIVWISSLFHDSIEDAIDLGNVQDEEEMIAFIHDSINDPKVAVEVVNVVLALTKPAGSDYSSYISSIIHNENALIVKLADMLDNLKDEPSPRQQKKYGDAIRLIEDSYGGKPDFIHPSHWEELLKVL